MTTNGRPPIDDPTIELDEPLQPLGSPNLGPGHHEMQIQLIQRMDELLEKAFRRFMRRLEFLSTSTLLFVCIAAAAVVCVIGMFRFNKDSFGSSFLDLMKTIIVAALGYLFGQKSKSGSDG